VIRVLIVDDQDIVRQGLGVILRHQPDLEVVGFAANGQEALDYVSSLAPDVVLMDLKMPVLNGIRATKRITEQFSQIKVIALTTYGSDEWVFDAIRAGASGYILKDSDSETIVRAVRGAVEGTVYLDPAVAGRVLQEFNRLATAMPDRALQGPAPSQAPETCFEPLTERELTILQELAQGRSNREIADALCLAEGTVKNYVSTIIGKLQANDRTQAAILALRRGLAKLEKGERGDHSHSADGRSASPLDRSSAHNAGRASAPPGAAETRS
jgi:DNA-binding NarL/FixJ family response regulator